VFTLAEMRRVGTAVTMMVIGGTAIILVLLMAMGHYNSLSHTLPKAILDGVVIAMLIGRQSRWRCLWLLGVVNGLVLVLITGVAYLVPVMVVAGAVGALTGRLLSPIHRACAIAAAAAVFELLAGFGAPIKIYFGTGGRDEPFVWALWFAEWPLRIFGAIAGAWLAKRLTRWAEESSADETSAAANIPPAQPVHRRRTTRVARGRSAAAVRLTASILACILPMLTQSPVILAALAVISVVYAVCVGLRWRVLYAMLGLLWGWLILSALSYLAHRDADRIIAMLWTFVARFTPLALASMALVMTTRPVDVIRVLRALRLPRVALLPLAHVVRAIPHSRQQISAGIHRLREDGIWTGPWSIFVRPVPIFRTLLQTQLRQWTRQLAEPGSDR